jgi:GDP-L-fucose synthase
MGVNDVQVWGTGKPRREFLHVDDLADACIFLLENYSDDEHINIGTGVDHSIKEISEILTGLIHPKANVCFDTTMPDGTLRKRLDVSKLTGLGWHSTKSLEKGLKETVEWYVDAIVRKEPLRQ